MLANPKEGVTIVRQAACSSQTPSAGLKTLSQKPEILRACPQLGPASCQLPQPDGSSACVPTEDFVLESSRTSLGCQALCAPALCGMGSLLSSTVPSEYEGHRSAGDGEGYATYKSASMAEVRHRRDPTLLIKLRSYRAGYGCTCIQQAHCSFKSDGPAWNLGPCSAQGNNRVVSC